MITINEKLTPSLYYSTKGHHTFKNILALINENPIKNLENRGTKVYLSDNFERIAICKPHSQRIELLFRKNAKNFQKIHQNNILFSEDNNCIQTSDGKKIIILTNQILDSKLRLKIVKLYERLAKQKDKGKLWKN